MNVLSGLLRAAFVVLATATLTLGLLLHSAEEHAPPRSRAETEPCPAPEGWSAHLVQVGENLTIIADIVGVAPAELVFANCLEGDLHPGDTVFLPPHPIKRVIVALPNIGCYTRSNRAIP